MQAIDLKVGDVFKKINGAHFETVQTKKTYCSSRGYVFEKGEVLIVLVSCWDFYEASQRLVLCRDDGQTLDFFLDFDSTFNVNFDWIFQKL